MGSNMTSPKNNMPPMSGICVYGFPESVRASKYPMCVDISTLTDEVTPRVASLGSSQAGSGNDQYLTGIVVQFDLTLTVKAWLCATG